MKKLSAGFTMIELLVVIGVLGILATGLLAAVDPFEQLKKARDTNNRQSVISLHTAFTRYYATHGSLPWDNTAISATSTCSTGTILFGADRATAPTPVALSLAAMGDIATPGTTCVGLLEADGELKPGFVGAIGTGTASTIYVTSRNASQVAICFSPTSKSVFAEENTKFDNAGNDLTGAAAPSVDCSAAAKAGNPAAGGSVPVLGGAPAATCYYCAK